LGPYGVSPASHASAHFAFAFAKTHSAEKLRAFFAIPINGTVKGMEVRPFWPTNWREIFGKTPLVLGVAILQSASEYYIWGHLNPTLALLLPPVIGWWLFRRILRPHGGGALPGLSSDRWLLVVVFTFLAWWAGLVLAANTYGT
jgi:hypothetical protein